MSDRTAAPITAADVVSLIPAGMELADLDPESIPVWAYTLDEDEVAYARELVEEGCGYVPLDHMREAMLQERVRRMPEAPGLSNEWSDEELDQIAAQRAADGDDRWIDDVLTIIAEGDCPEVDDLY